MLSGAGNSEDQAPSEGQKTSEPSQICPCPPVPSNPVSPPVAMASRVVPGSQVFRSPTCTYTKTNDFRTIECMNLTLGHTLGCGTFAEVKGAFCNTNKHLLALKIVNKAVVCPRYLASCLPMEIQLLMTVSHPRVIATYNIVETHHQVFFLMELAENGDLEHYLRGRGYLQEEEARYLFQQFTEGMQYLHDSLVAHRDIKCENILLDRNMNVKIADFGFGINIAYHLARSACGSYAFAAPELLMRSMGGYDARKVDVWGMGCILFVMVTGELVFGDSNTCRKTQDREVRFPPDVPLTDTLKDLILSMLKMDPNSRPTSHDIAQHVWTSSGIGVQPIQPLKFTPKFTMENLGIQFRIPVIPVPKIDLEP